MSPMASGKIKGSSPNRRQAATAMLLGGYGNIAIVTIQAFVLVPITLRVVGTTLYGAWLGSGNIVAWLGILEMGTASIMIQRIASAYGRDDKQTVADYFATGLLAQAVLVVVFMLGATGVAAFIPQWMGIHGSDTNVLAGCFLLASLANCVSIVNNGVAGFAQAMQHTVFLNVATAVCTIAGFGATIIFLWTGYGLWSIPFGLLIRNIALLFSNCLFARRLYREKVGIPARISKSAIGDLKSLMGPVFLANLGNAAMGKSDVALVAIFIRPEAATIYALSRRAAEVIMMLLDRTGAAVFGGFAHLVGGGSLTQAKVIYRNLIYKQISIAAVMLSTFLAFNKAFVGLWVGKEQFGGPLLSDLLGFAVVGGSIAGTLGYLYGATGRIVRGSYVILGEAIARFLLMIALLLTLGLIGPAVATIATSLGSGMIYYRFTLVELEGLGDWRKGISATLWIYAGLVLTGSVIGCYLLVGSWLGLFVEIGAYTVTTSIVVVFVDPNHADVVRLGRSTVQRLLRHQAS